MYARRRKYIKPEYLRIPYIQSDRIVLRYKNNETNLMSFSETFSQHVIPIAVYVVYNIMNSICVHYAVGNHTVLSRFSSGDLKRVLDTRVCFRFVIIYKLLYCKIIRAFV